MKFHMDGNNGGDYFHIEKSGDGMVLVEVGHSCVVYARHFMPIEVLTATLAKAWEDTPKQEMFTGEYGDRLNSAVKKDDLMGYIR